MEVFGTWPEFIPEDRRRDEVLAAQLGVIAPRDGATEAIGGRRPMTGSDAETIQQNVFDSYDVNEGGDHQSALKIGREGGWVSTKRLEDMDADGIDVAVLYPTNLLGVIDDVELFAVSCRAYNDWMHDYCSVDSKRLIGVGVVPLQDLDLARQEARRCVQELGCRALMIRPAP